MTDSLKNKKVILTGAGKGIGKATAIALIKAGVNLAVLSRNPENIEFPEAGTKIDTFLCDLLNGDSIVNAYGMYKAKYGPPDILINNAGIAKFKPLAELSAEDFDEMIQVNLKAPFLLSKLAVNDMMAVNNGVIVNVTSVSANTTYKNSSVYSATKAGLLMMANCLREEVRDKNIKIINIIPGATKTNIWSPRALEKFSDRMMEPEDIAATIVHAVTDSLNPRSVVEEIVIRPQLGDL